MGTSLVVDMMHGIQKAGTLPSPTAHQWPTNPVAQRGT